MLTKYTVVIISQYMQILNHNTVYLKLLACHRKTMAAHSVLTHQNPRDREPDEAAVYARAAQSWI